ncbi:MAG: polyprenyl synthetase family protein [Caldilineaceae bacterium]
MSEGNDFDSFGQQWLPLLEDEMRAVLTSQESAVAEHYGMMHYHLGWVDESLQAGEFGSGKRIRPLLCLMACASVGGDPATALSAAAAVEILHNFSLIHDDIEDGDETRRHRPTVWTLWGVPQAINAGDGMFALSFAALLRSKQRGVGDRSLVAMLERFTACCTALTEGQHLDIGFEDREKVAVADYLRMIEGKTAVLLATALSIGALIGGADQRTDEALYGFGQHLGLAFQIQDDILGIWGDPTVTGKAAGNDILRRKKSLPLLYALNHPTVGDPLADMLASSLGDEDLPTIHHLLDVAGAKAFAEEQLYNHHQSGLAGLKEALGTDALTSPLRSLADGLLLRQA